MLRYTLSRIIQAAFVMLVMTFLLFVLINLMPGDPVDNMLEGNPSLTAEVAQRIRELYGVGVPLPVRYWNWLVSAVQGDFGYSSLYFRPVAEILGPALGQTLKLMIATLVLSVPIAMVLGTLAALRPGGLIDNIISFFAFAAISLPNFWLSLILIIVFAVHLGWLPASGTPMSDTASLGEQIEHLVLPVAGVRMFFVGPLVGYVRASMIGTRR